MKYVKILGLAAVAAMAMMAFAASSASADELCTNKEGACTQVTSIEASLTGGTVRLNNTAGESINTCTGGSAGGAVESQGTGKTIEGKIPTEKLTWTGCTFTTKTLNGGTLKVNDISGGPNGTVVSSGGEVTINTVLFGSCIYGTGTETDLGTLKGGANASLEINVVVNKISGSNIACPSTAKWVANYQITNHKEVYVRNS